MGILRGLAPFILFAVMTRLASLQWALAASAILAVVVVVYERARHGRSLKILEVGTVILFCGLTLISFVTPVAWSLATVHLTVDCGLLLIALISLLMGNPFTLQYARESVPEHLWQSPLFKRVNTIITSVWTAAFAVQALVDAVWLEMPSIPGWIAVAASVAVLFGAIRFTLWYPGHAREQAMAGQG